MKNSALIILALFFSISSFGQEINQINNKGLKQGVWIKKIEGSDKLVYKGLFKNNIPVGHWEYYYPDQTIKAIIDYTNDLSHSKIYHPNGKLMGEGDYIKNPVNDTKQPYIKHGVWKFYDLYGNISSEDSYVLGQKTGLAKVYYLNEKLASEINYLNGEKEGAFVEYFEDGSVMKKGFIKDGNYEGELISYNDDGVIYMKGSYKNGVKHGQWVILNEDGEHINYVFVYGELQTNK